MAGTRHQERASQAIRDVFSDTSVGQQTTIDRLRDLATECEDCITMIEDDMAKYEIEDDSPDVEGGE